MKRIVMFEGGVETLAYFSHRMAEQFGRMGYAVFFYDLKNEEYSARKLRKFLRMGETVLVTFNFQGLEKEAGVYKEGVGYVWDAYKIPCYNIAADHPYFYHDRLTDLPAEYHHISIDRLQEAYFKEFYPEFEHEGFLPLAGTMLIQGENDEDLAKSETVCVEAAGKCYDVIFTGNYTKLSFFEPYINWINDEYAAFYRGIIDELIEKPYQTVEQVALKHCEREMGKEPNDQLRIALSKMIFIDLYVRNYWRGKVVRTLVNAGISVDVVGKGWEELEDIRYPENLRIHPQTDSLTCLKMLAQSKVSVNVMPWFKDGAHDRVFNSILNGAVCVSDTSKYLCEELKEGEGVCYYELEDIEELPDKVKDLLQNEKKMQDIVARGRVKVLDVHTWEKRAEQVAEWFER
ncbi:MAG: glycosyltransferase [Clostridiales bacterium]|nr:glycosyltransferase [Roseburia sp.]MDD7638356.1 glycosyltransferase [Clostridiales bacterium]MDY4112928.1 glycosyltransferase [Roseburia sp.]